jgi:hypothetical protein
MLPPARAPSGTLRLARRAWQLSLLISVLNSAYKTMVVWSGVKVQFLFTQRDALIEQMEVEAGVRAGSGAPATTSSGEPLDARSLAAKVGR